MLHLQTKAPGDELVSRPVDLEVSFDEVFGERQEAYQRLLEDAMVGDTRRFGRADALVEQWRIFEAALADAAPGEPLPPGHLGPERRPTPSRCVRAGRLARARSSTGSHGVALC